MITKNRLLIPPPFCRIKPLLIPLRIVCQITTFSVRHRMLLTRPSFH